MRSTEVGARARTRTRSGRSQALTGGQPAMKTAARPAPQRFMATIYKIWMMRHVDVPEDVACALVKEITRGTRAKKQEKPARSRQAEIYSRGGNGER